ncbi:MAG: hypothetical protein JOZ39_01700 [Chloroflexi bacterium]|nr:hypothetical protein [Chloroflexota bacterium]
MRDVLLTGSMPLRPARAVFDLVGTRLRDHIRRIPDGEQSGWLRAATRTFDEHPSLEPAGPVRLNAWGYSLPTYRVRAGESAKGLRLGPYGYAANAIASYEQFREARAAGSVAPGTRFQVTMPGPGTSAYLIRLAADLLLPLARKALAREIEALTVAIPASELAVQLDVAMEAEHEEYLRRPEAFPLPVHEVFDWTLEQMAASVAWLGNRVPVDAELGLHICSIWHHYPDSGQDNCVLVDAANAIVSRLERPLNYLHIPVIPAHTRADYAVLANLICLPETRLYLGLINLADGVEGARARIDMAQQFLPDFGVAFFCGLGFAGASAPSAQPGLPPPASHQRATAETLPSVLDLHRAVAEL